MKLQHRLYKHPSLFRHLLSFYPPYWGTGISIAELSPDFSRMVVSMRKRFYNRNAFGTHFGGSLYAMCDPHFVILLMPLLGPDYFVWDKAASIEFVRPGRMTVTATFEWTKEQVEDIRVRTSSGEKYEPVRTVDVVHPDGEVVARVQKTLYVKRKSATT